MADLALPAIRAIETLEVRGPRSARNRITTSYATLPDAHHALVRVHADEFTGIGEAPAELSVDGRGRDVGAQCDRALPGATADRRAARAS